MGVSRYLIAASLLALPLTSCVRTPGTGPAVRSPYNLSETEARSLGQSRWNELRAAMTPSERSRFDQITDEDARLRFSRANGVDVRIELNHKLREGMTRDEVVDALQGTYDTFGLGDPRVGRLHASVFNGEASTHMDFEFDLDSERLVSWTSYVPKVGDRTGALEAALLGRLDRVLRVGMGQGEITESYNRALRLAADYDRKAVERRGDESNYKGFRSSSSGDYAMEAAWIRAQSASSFYEILNRRPDYIRQEKRNEFWYHNITVPGITEKVVIEYRFEDKRLTSWWVYNTDFQGYVGSK